MTLDHANVHIKLPLLFAYRIWLMITQVAVWFTEMFCHQEKSNYVGITLFSQSDFKKNETGNPSKHVLASHLLLTGNQYQLSFHL